MKAERGTIEVIEHVPALVITIDKQEAHALYALLGNLNKRDVERCVDENLEALECLWPDNRRDGLLPRLCKALSEVGDFSW